MHEHTDLTIFSIYHFFRCFPFHHFYSRLFSISLPSLGSIISEFVLTSSYSYEREKILNDVTSFRAILFFLHFVWSIFRFYSYFFFLLCLSVSLLFFPYSPFVVSIFIWIFISHWRWVPLECVRYVVGSVSPFVGKSLLVLRKFIAFKRSFFLRLFLLCVHVRLPSNFWAKMHQLQQHIENCLAGDLYVVFLVYWFYRFFVVFCFASFVTLVLWNR